MPVRVRPWIGVAAIAAVLLLAVAFTSTPRSSTLQQIETTDPLAAFREGQVNLPVMGSILWTVTESEKQVHEGTYRYENGREILVSRDVMYDATSPKGFLKGTLFYNAFNGHTSGWLHAASGSSSPEENAVVEFSGDWGDGVLVLEVLIDGPDGRSAFEAAIADLEDEVAKERT